MEAVSRAGELARRARDGNVVSAASGWRVDRLLATAQEHHARDLPWDRFAVLCEHSDRAIVLGSTQQVSDIDSDLAANRGVSVVRRRSGGGAVFLAPDESIWVDVVIQRDDPLWTDDVSSSALWLGDAWRGALSALGIDGLVVHAGPMVTSGSSRTICFEGLASGELTRDGAKMVGISQRRTRDGARFQCVLYRVWDASQWAGFLTSVGAREALNAVSVATVDAPTEAVWGAFDSILQTLN